MHAPAFIVVRSHVEGKGIQVRSRGSATPKSSNCFKSISHSPLFPYLVHTPVFIASFTFEGNKYPRFWQGGSLNIRGRPGGPVTEIEGGFASAGESCPSTGGSSSDQASALQQTSDGEASSVSVALSKSDHILAHPQMRIRCSYSP